MERPPEVVGKENEKRPKKNPFSAGNCMMYAHIKHQDVQISSPIADG